MTQVTIGPGLEIQWLPCVCPLLDMKAVSANYNATCCWVYIVHHGGDPCQHSSVRKFAKGWKGP